MILDKENNLKSLTPIPKDINEIYENYCLKPGDINEHLPLLKEYALKCSHVTEMGVRYIVSTWAFVAAKPKKIISIDKIHPIKFNAGYQFDILLNECKKNNINFIFYEKDTNKIEIEETDLLFIDTLHNYEQLKNELKLHSSKVKKYICFHDVETYGKRDEIGNGKGILLAIEEFLLNNINKWKIVEHKKNNNGLMILEKING